MKKIVNILALIGGFIFLGIGAVGMFIPILPTTPFFILAALLLAKGSTRFHTWFINTNMYKTYIGKAMKDKKMSKKEKIKLFLGLTLVFGFAIFIIPVIYAQIFVFVVYLGHIYYFMFRIKTEKEETHVQ